MRDRDRESGGGGGGGGGGEGEGERFRRARKGDRRRRQSCNTYLRILLKLFHSQAQESSFPRNSLLRNSKERYLLDWQVSVNPYTIFHSHLNRTCF